MSPEFPNNDALIRLIYQGVLTAQPWQDLARALRAPLNASHVDILFKHTRQRGSEDLDILDFQSPTGALPERYREQFAEMDPVPYFNLTPGIAYQLTHFLEGGDSNPYYREFLAPANIQDILMFYVRNETHCCWIAAARRAGEGEFEEKDRQFGEWLCSHLSVALDIHSRLRRVELERDTHTHALRNFNIGYTLIDQQGKLVDQNNRMTELLATHKQIYVHDGRLRLQSPDKNQELQSLIHEGLSTEDADFSRALHISGSPSLGLLIKATPGATLTERPLRGKRFVVRKSSSHEDNPDYQIPLLAIYINEFNHHSEPPGERLAELFDLNRKEAALVLELIRGKTLAEAAKAIHISEQTARSYSKRVFSKTGARRQAELLQLILTSVALMA